MVIGGRVESRSWEPHLRGEPSGGSHHPPAPGARTQGPPPCRPPGYRGSVEARPLSRVVIIVISITP